MNLILSSIQLSNWTEPFQTTKRCWIQNYYWKQTTEISDDEQNKHELNSSRNITGDECTKDVSKRLNISKKKRTFFCLNKESLFWRTIFLQMNKNCFKSYPKTLERGITRSFHYGDECTKSGWIIKNLPQDSKNVFLLNVKAVKYWNFMPFPDCYIF